ncbi:hypothetical protein BH11BAC4_BH11BAC4_21820 [soil metagenome]
MNINMQLFRSTLLVSCLSFFLLSCNHDTKPASKAIISSRDSLSNKESVNPYATHDQSPMDMSYYPPDYPVLRMNGTDSTNLLARIIYSRPQKKGRVIFGDSEKSLCLYGKEWRLGANEATEIDFFKPVIIDGKKIEKGSYVIYCIPFADRWKIILNSNLYTWGLHMDATKDIFNTTIPITVQIPAIEDFTMVFEPAANGTNLVMVWDNVKAVLPISFSK